MLDKNGLEVYATRKLMQVQDASKIISELKSSGRKAGLCHGSFDLLHPGNVKHFESAKKYCDALFVSITSDHFVRIRKGIGRPIYNEMLRAYMVASIELVDYVLISNHKTGIEVIKELKPDFYIKGPDYMNSRSPELMSEKMAVESVGGEMKFTNDFKLSSTGIIGMLKNSKN